MDTNTVIPPEFVQAFVKKTGLSREAVREASQFMLRAGFDLNKELVGVREFVESPHYLNAQNTLYPAVRGALIELNEGDYIEAVLTGAIGCGKTTLALYTQAYQLYLLSCYKDPQSAFGLDRSSEIIIIFQNINERLAKHVDYERFKAMIGESPYFRQYFMYDKDVAAELRFPNRIFVKPIVGTETGAIGHNVIGGVIDEVNFMQLVERSKRTMDGGTYDQALALYNAISRRRKSRFMKLGRLPGILCLVSSKRYPGQFTDQKIEDAKKEIKDRGKTGIYVYDKTTWDIKPAATFTGEWFHVYAGDATRKPRILAKGETVPPKDRELVIKVPIEYRTEFEKDIMNALRDIAGRSTVAVHPFMMDTEAVAACFSTHRSILSRTDVDYKDTRLLAYPRRLVDPSFPRWVHVDLALSGDSAGVAMGYVPRFKRIKRGRGEEETLPEIRLDFTLEVRPPRGGEILFHRIRATLYKLRQFGLNIKWASFDGFQSADSIQILRQKGFVTGVRSMDKRTAPYEILKTALYDRRVKIPTHEKLLTELVSLEKDERTGKIDHRPHGSKDIADALAGVVYGLTMRREVWALHGIPPISLPGSIVAVLQQDEKGSDEDEAL